MIVPLAARAELKAAHMRCVEEIHEAELRARILRSSESPRTMILVCAGARCRSFCAKLARPAALVHAREEDPAPTINRPGA